MLLHSGNPPTVLVVAEWANFTQLQWYQLQWGLPTSVHGTNFSGTNSSGWYQSVSFGSDNASWLPKQLELKRLTAFCALKEEVFSLPRLNNVQ